MVRPVPHFAKSHGHIPTNCDEARHELRWQTVRWFLRHAYTGHGFGRPALDNPGPEGHDIYCLREASPWERRPAKVVQDLRAICDRAKLWKDNLHPELANSTKSYEEVVHHRVGTWDEPMFEDLMDRVRELDWLGRDAYPAVADFRKLVNYELRQARLQERLDVLDAEASAAQLVDVERDANPALGTW